jgi:hypothetical protein
MVDFCFKETEKAFKLSGQYLINIQIEKICPTGRSAPETPCPAKKMRICVRKTGQIIFK